MGVFLSIAAIYYITLALTNYDGPGDAFIKLREQWAPKSLKKLLSCFVCLSNFIAIPFAILLATDLGTFFLYWLGLAGAATFLYKLSEE